MKKIFRIFSSAMAVVLLSACADNLNNEITAPENDASVQTGNLLPMTFSATMEEDVESRTTLDSSTGGVLWEASDAITVFSVGEGVTTTPFNEPELLENNAVARFSGLADASAETYYAVYPHSEANTYDGEKFTVNFPAEQTAVANGFASGSNVSVAVSVKDAELTEANLQFKNAGALLAFSFNTDYDAANTKSVTFRARKSADDAQTAEFWGLTGNVAVTIDANGLPVASGGSEDHVTVIAPEGFVSGKSYYVPVCPVGDCTGMEMTFTNQNDESFVRNNNVDFQLQRSSVFKVGAVPYPYDDLPKEFTVTIDLTKNGWSFVEEPATEQKLWTAIGEGDEYTYNYPYYSINSGFAKSLPLTFRIMRSKTTSSDDKYNYIVTEDGLKSGTEAGSYGGVMYIPGIPNRYLVEAGIMMVKADKNETTAFGFSTENSFSSNSTGAGIGKETIFYLYNDKITSNASNNGKGTAVLSGPAYLRFRWGGTVVSSLRLRYSSTSPGNAPAATAE